MSKLILLFISLILGLVFVMLPDWDGSFMTPDPFPYFDFKIGGISYQTYAYMIAEYLVSLIFVGIIASDATKYRLSIWVFFWLVVADLIDYLLFYNAIWFYWGPVPVSMNTTKVFIFGLTIFYEWLTSIGTRYFG